MIILRSRNCGGLWVNRSMSCVCWVGACTHLNLHQNHVACNVMLVLMNFFYPSVTVTDRCDLISRINPLVSITRLTLYLLCYLIQIAQLKLRLATESHNFKWAKIAHIFFNPLTAKLFNLSFHPLEVVDRVTSE